MTSDLQSMSSSNVAALLVEGLKHHKLALLSEKNLADALVEFVDKEERDAIKA